MALVLIVEDQVITGMHLKQLVKNMGHDVYGPVTTGKAAIEKSCEVSPDIILMDIFLIGKIDGIDAVKQIHKKKQIPVIYITASSDEFTYKRARKTCMVGFLRKPLMEDEVEKKIKEALMGKE